MHTPFLEKYCYFIYCVMLILKYTLILVIDASLQFSLLSFIPLLNFQTPAEISVLYTFISHSQNTSL